MGVRQETASIFYNGLNGKSPSYQKAELQAIQHRIFSPLLLNPQSEKYWAYIDGIPNPLEQIDILNQVLPNLYTVQKTAKPRIIKLFDQATQLAQKEPVLSNYLYRNSATLFANAILSTHFLESIDQLAPTTSMSLRNGLNLKTDDELIIAIDFVLFKRLDDRRYNKQPIFNISELAFLLDPKLHNRSNFFNQMQRTLSVDNQDTLPSSPTEKLQLSAA